MYKYLIQQQKEERTLKASKMDKDYKACLLKQSEQLNGLVEEVTELMVTSAMPGFYSARDELQANVDALKANIELAEKLYEFTGLRKAELFDAILEDNRMIIRRVQEFGEELRAFVRKNVSRVEVDTGEELERFTAMLKGGEGDDEY